MFVDVYKRQVFALGQRPRLTPYCELDPQTGRARLLHEPVDVGQTRRRRELRRRSVGPQQPQGTVHLGHRLAAEVRDRRRVARDAGVVDRRTESLCLHDHQAHVVSYDVVKLLRYAHPLNCDGSICQ